jgi:hypothetical protein
MKRTLAFLTALLLLPLATHAADKPVGSSRPDIVLADFEQGYGKWTVEGEAFNHPPRGFFRPTGIATEQVHHKPVALSRIVLPVK